MDYLTNYYKNLSEQLQEKLNMLEAQIREANDPTNMDTSPGKTGGKDIGITPSKSKRTPEQDKAIKEWDAKYGLFANFFAKDRPKGKFPPRPYDPDEPPPTDIG